jgi:hypothetical protein
VLGTVDERRVSIGPDLTRLLLLDDWHHADVIGGEPPAGQRRFVSVLAEGDRSLFSPVEPPNTHWEFWPGGDSL